MTEDQSVSQLTGVIVSRETELKLRHFASLVRKWTKGINLVSAASLPDLWNRHVLDSVQIYQDAPRQPFHWVDIGSGGGFPGIIIAILAKDIQAESKITLVESDQRKAAFLRAAARDLDLKIDVLSSRIELTLPLAADIVSARALGPLTTLIGYAKRHLKPSGRALLPKGRSFQSEIDAARLEWTFDLTIRQSLTDPEAQILSIGKIVHV